MNHISTHQTFEHGCPTIIMQCPICQKKCKHFTGYTHIRCSNCNSTFSDEEWLGSIARMIRCYLGLSRRQIADKLGYKIETIQRYEFVECSRKYYEKLITLVNRPQNLIKR